MTSYKYMSDGLGGHVGLSCSPGLGSAKGVTKKNSHFNLQHTPSIPVQILFFPSRRAKSGSRLPEKQRAIQTY